MASPHLDPNHFNIGDCVEQLAFDQLTDVSITIPEQYGVVIGSVFSSAKGHHYMAIDRVEAVPPVASGEFSESVFNAFQLTGSAVKRDGQINQGGGIASHDDRIVAVCGFESSAINQRVAQGILASVIFIETDFGLVHEAPVEG